MENLVARKRTGIIAALLVCALVGCFALVGCSSSGSGSSKEQYVGYWECESGTSSEDDFSASEMELLRSYGLNVILHLSEDGTGELDMMGTVSDVTWDAGTITIDGADADMKIDDSGKLVLSDSDAELIFVKGDDSLADEMTTS